jgi:putative ABC transport system permease protein
MESMQNDIFRIPLVLEPRTYGYAAVVILVSSLLSGIVIRQKINQLDLVGVLKTRE